MTATDIATIHAMVRWEPGAGERLRDAAMELFVERGYEETTVAEIAARAGVTERTFFRHFSDKREVLFAGGEALGEVIAEAAADAEPSLQPLAAALEGIRAGAAALEPRRAFARRRAALIAANPELRERELIKLATYADALAAALRSRGVGDTAAALAAELAVAVFRIAFERWAAGDGCGPLADGVGTALEDLRQLAAA